MSATELIVLTVTLAVVLVAAPAWWLARRRQHEPHGRPGHGAGVEGPGSSREPGPEPAAARGRRPRLKIRPLDPQLRRWYADEWRAAQARFVDEPDVAFVEAGCLVEDAMVERGYPVGEAGWQMSDLSVEHSEVLDHYRRARDVAQEAAAGRATTADLRRGMGHYRALFAALLVDEADAPTSQRS